MFKWLKSLWEKSFLQETAKVVFDEHCVTCHRPDGTKEEIDWQELTAVDIVTTDAGPLAEDVYWVLHGSDRGCAVPQGADGFGALLARLQDLPGFNNQTVIDAMSCASNARFPVWRRITERPGDNPGR